MRTIFRFFLPPAQFDGFGLVRTRGHAKKAETLLEIPEPRRGNMKKICPKSIFFYKKLVFLQMSNFFKPFYMHNAHPKIIFKINIIFNLNNGMIFHFASANRTRKGIPLQFLYKQAEKVESPGARLRQL